MHTESNTKHKLIVAIAAERFSLFHTGAQYLSVSKVQYAEFDKLQ